jgi:EAL domain-containing protein (putative c-di-GMP-specific phosphodiesterase class I)
MTGVETLQQLELLKSVRCDFAQGYYLSGQSKLEDLYEFKVKSSEK